ncbi:MAG: hypothetical protein ACKOA4_09475, partial [Haliscomenobacter sp.]
MLKTPTDFQSGDLGFQLCRKGDDTRVIVENVKAGDGIAIAEVESQVLSVFIAELCAVLYAAIFPFDASEVVVVLSIPDIREARQEGVERAEGAEVVLLQTPFCPCKRTTSAPSARSTPSWRASRISGILNTTTTSEASKG